ncbi:MAG: nucleotide exchange factor GrpE [Dehalococcoidia bacterium]|nr:MAG: nucleotide exchange factor GrpE [Dehalococcoidia bacterium]UCG82743.1 MAG: nucleotide exchange factor GrpE [Dehalococcoidia bacterium]
MSSGKKKHPVTRNENASGEVKDVAETEDLESIKAALEEAKQNADKYLANWQRSEADFINYKRRSEQERADLASFANANLMTALLPVVDDLERALENATDDIDIASWIDGIRLIYRKLKAALEEHGLSEIAAEGKEFDPNLHEAVMCVEGKEGIVCGEIQRGYRLRERLLRPSMVAVGKEEGGSKSGEGHE